MKKTGFKNPLILASVIALGISTALTAYNFFAYLTIRIDWITSSDNAAPLVAIFGTLVDILSLVGAIVAILLVATNQKPTIVLALYIFTVVAAIPVGILTNLIYSAAAGYESDFGQMLSWFFNMNWANPGIPFTEKIADFSNFFGFVALVLYVIGGLVKFSDRQPAGVTPTANAFDPMTGQPIAQPVAQPVYAQGSNGAPFSNLPQVGFILAILMPLVGVIISHVALSQMRAGQISNVNEKQAKNGLLIGYILMGVGFIVSVIVIIGVVIFAAASYNSYY